MYRFSYHLPRPVFQARHTHRSMYRSACMAGMIFYIKAILYVLLLTFNNLSYANSKIVFSVDMEGGYGDDWSIENATHIENVKVTRDGISGNYSADLSMYCGSQCYSVANGLEYKRLKLNDVDAKAKIPSEVIDAIRKLVCK